MAINSFPYLRVVGRRVFAHPVPEPSPQVIPLGFAQQRSWSSSGLQEAFATSADAPAGPDALAGPWQNLSWFWGG